MTNTRPARRRIKARSVFRTFAAIAADLDSSKRHWSEVAEASRVRLALPNLTDREAQRYAFEMRVADAAIARIATGRAPSSLVMSEAARELRVSIP